MGARSTVWRSVQNTLHLTLQADDYKVPKDDRIQSRRQAQASVALPGACFTPEGAWGKSDLRVCAWQGVLLQSAHPDLDGIVPGLVDAQLLLRLLGVHGHLQLIQQAHIPAIIIQHVDPCTQQREMSNPRRSAE